MLAWVVLPAAFTGKTTKSLAQLGMAVTSKVYLAGYIEGAVPAVPRLMAQSRCVTAGTGAREGNVRGSRRMGNSRKLRNWRWSNARCSASRQRNIALGSLRAASSAAEVPVWEYREWRVDQSWILGERTCSKVGGPAISRGSKPTGSNRSAAKRPPHGRGLVIFRPRRIYLYESVSYDDGSAFERKIAGVD